MGRYTPTGAYARTRARYIEALHPRSVKLWLWLVQRADDDGIVRFPPRQIRRVRGMKKPHSLHRAIVELALGNPPIPPLIEVLQRPANQNAGYIIKIIEDEG